MKKMIYLIVGFISLALGCVGIVLPILPTTPFLILSVYCFAKSSKRLEIWLLSTKIYKKYAKGFVEDKSMTLKAKLAILLPVSVILLVGFYFSKAIYAKAILLFLLVAKYLYFFLVIKTKKEDLAVEVDR
ncbi:MAG: YbaN family protein [Tissierellia bacterium]|nr:YbaN family protein [Tissierellia bacterium]